METKRAIALSIEPQQIIAAVKAMSLADREDFLEDLIAATSPRYLESIQGAREDARRGKTKGHDQIFRAR
mgnify:CR=1 FL=1